MPDDDLTTAITQAERRQVSIRALLLGTGPRFARNAIGAYPQWTKVHWGNGIQLARVKAGQ